MGEKLKAAAQMLCTEPDLNGILKGNIIQKCEKARSGNGKFSK